MKNANTFPSTDRYFAAKIIEYGNTHLVKDACLLIQHPCMPHILSNKINCALLKILITFEPAAIPASKFPEIFSTPVQMILNQFHVNFENNHGHRTFLVFSNFVLPPSRSTMIRHFCFERVSFQSVTTEKHVLFSHFVLSITWADTQRLSGDDCLQDTGMLEPGILRSRVAAHFNFHRDTGGRLNKKDGLTRYGNSHVKDKTS